MSPLRPGRSGALAAALALILAGLLAATAAVLVAGPRPALPAAGHPWTGSHATHATGALARIAVPPRISSPPPPDGPDPAGPDTPGITTLVSAWTPTATSVAGPSSQADVSNDGRFVAYASTATAIVPSVTGSWSRIYELDRTTGVTTLISSTLVTVGGKPDQLPRNSQAVEPSVDADGGVIAYVLVPPPIVGAVVVPDQSFVIVHDNATGTDVELAPGSHPSISGTGRFVAFDTSSALDPTLDANKVADVYVLDRTTGTATLASVGPNGHAPPAPSSAPSLAVDASAVAFTSAARLLLTDHDPSTDVYVRRLVTPATILVSVHAGADSGASSGPAISGNGRFVAFSSRASTLAAGPRAGGGADADVYVRDLTLKTTVRLSRAAGGGAADGASSAAAISADGQTIAFASAANDLVPGDTNDAGDIFIAERVGGRITRASLSSTDAQAGAGSAAPALSADGSVLAFESRATNLAPGAHGSTDVYLRVRLPKAVVTPAALSFPARPVGSTSPPAPVTVRNTGAGPLVLGSVAIAGVDPTSFTIVANGCAGAILEHAQTCVISVSFRPALPGSSVAGLVVSDNDPSGSQTVPLDGGTLAPTIVVDPAIGPPGFVTSAIGTNFPPGASVTLTWSVGLTASMPPVVADAAGTFTVQVLILPRDTLGPRILAGTFTASGGGSAASQPFLVVPGTDQPPFDPARIPGQPEGPVFRH
jgi:Tol biopolymer transport system component